VDDADLYFQYTRARAGAWRRASSRPARSPSTRAWACARSAARRRPLPIPTTFPKPRCWMPPAPCAPSRREPAAARECAKRLRKPLAVPGWTPSPRWTARPRSAAGQGGKAGPRQGPARGAGHGRPGQRVRRGAGGACRRHAGGRCAPAGAPVGHGDRRAGAAARWVGRRWRPLRPGLFHDEQISQYVDEAVHAALVNLESRPARPAK
jgi:hypothetical protein